VIGGPEELRAAALEAILQWHYSPAAMTLPTTTQVTMDFKLPKEGTPATLTHNAPPQLKPFTLKSIEIEGLSTSGRDELIGRLPIHAGDTIDGDVMQSVDKTARAFDDHLHASANPDSGVVHIALGSYVQPQAGPLRIRVGGNVQQAKLVSQVHPVYPPEAKAQGIQGIVRLQAILGKDGKVENLEMLSGEPMLAAAAMDAVRQWQYQTTLLNGDPVEVVTQIDVNFTLAK
jgi:TonB family protein